MILNENVQMVEIAWTTGAVIGLGLAVMRVINAREDYRHLRRAGMNSWLGLIAWGALRNEVMRTVIHTIFVIIGVAAMQAPPRLERPVPIEIVSWGLVLIIWLLVVQGVANWRDQRRLMAYGKQLMK